MAAAARRGPRLREKFGQGGTDVGVVRARQLVDQRAQWNSDSDPSAGFVAWLLWGGDAGKAWADRKGKAAA
jgi:hypothetical protein